MRIPCETNSLRPSASTRITLTDSGSVDANTVAGVT
jgi:hypothetical protein